MKSESGDGYEALHSAAAGPQRGVRVNDSHARAEILSPAMEARVRERMRASGGLLDRRTAIAAERAEMAEARDV